MAASEKQESQDWSTRESFEGGIHRTQSLDNTRLCQQDHQQNHLSDSDCSTVHSDSDIAKKFRKGRESFTSKLSSLFRRKSDSNYEHQEHGQLVKSYSEGCSCESVSLLNSDCQLQRNDSLVMKETMGPVMVTVEFYAEKAAEKMDLIEGDPMTNFRKGRRTCVIPTLELGDQAVEENSGSQAYPGDLVLTTGHSLRRQSPPLVNGNSSDHYGSEGSLIDTATPAKDERTKTLERKPKTSIFNIDRWRGKKAIMPELEYVLQTLVPTEFKDERLASKRHLHWQDLIDNPEEDLSNISEQEKSRRDAVWEIFTNECTFLVDHLMVLKHCFMEPLLKCQVEGLLMDIEPPKLFGNLNELCDLSYRFCRDFYNQLKSLPMSEFASVSCLCDCLDIMTWYSRDGDIYHSYLLNYRSALTYLDILRNTLDDYALYEKFCEQDPRCNKLRLSDLLIAPMQHWTRLPLILERVRKYTTNQSDIDRLNSSTEKVVCSLKSLENKMEWLKTFERVKEIEKQLIWPTISEIDSKAFIPDTLKGLLSVQPTKHILDDKIREITFEGPLLLTEKDRNVDVYVFLFTDFLLFTKVKKKVRGRMSIIEKDGFYQVLRQPIPVHSLSVHDIGAAESNSSGMKNLFVIVQRNSFQQIVGVFSLQAHTSLGKQKWLSHLRDNKEKSRAEINNNGSQLSELASRQKTFRDMHEYGSYSSLLKHSQVLPLEAKTSHTLPRNHRNHIYAAPSTSSQSAAELTTDSNPPSTRQKRILDRSKTLSAGCLVSDRSFSLANGSPIK